MQTILAETFDGAADFRNAVVLRLRQRALWDRAAGHRALKPFEANAVTSRLLDLADIRDDLCVLDLACGSGDPTIAAAQRAVDGHVLGLDISPAMIVEARLAARRANLDNATFRLIDSETEIGVPEAGFDVALCRFGLMFMPDPIEALRTLKKAVNVGGKVVACTHGGMRAFEVTMREIEQRAPLLSTSLEWRRVLALSSESVLADSFMKAGLENVVVYRERTLTAASPELEACWDAMLSRSPLRDALDALPTNESTSIRDGCISRLVALGAPVDEIFSGDVLYAVGVVPSEGREGA